MTTKEKIIFKRLLDRVTLLEYNLKIVLEVLQEVRVGKNGKAYIPEGRVDNTDWSDAH